MVMRAYRMLTEPTGKSLDVEWANGQPRTAPHRNLKPDIRPVTQNHPTRISDAALNALTVANAAAQAFVAIKAHLKSTHAARPTAIDASAALQKFILEIINDSKLKALADDLTDSTPGQFTIDSSLKPFIPHTGNRKLLLKGYSLDTRRAYEYHWAHFCTFCVKLSLTPIPATKETIYQYLLWQIASSSRKQKTIMIKIIAIKSVHTLANLDVTWYDQKAMEQIIEAFQNSDEA